MRCVVLVLLLMPLISLSQDSSREFFLGYEHRNPKGYHFSGFVVGTNYQLNKLPLFKHGISSENYFLSVEMGHATLEENPKVYTRQGSMQTVKIGYQYKSHYQLYYMLRFRIDAVNDPSYRYNANRSDDYPMKSFTAYGPELMIGKKFNVHHAFFVDVGIGLTYNWSYEIVSSGNGWFDPSKPQSYSWLNYWSKGALKIGYQF